MPAQIDARGPRFGAAITVLVLGTVFISIHSVIALPLLVLQTIAFGIGVVVGPHAQPYGQIFAKLVKPRLTGPAPIEPSAPPRFAQGVGLGFALVALVALQAGLTSLALIAIGFAWAAAFLNAVFNFCLGCEIYLLAKRATSARS